jgi:hypothetical protein
VSQKRSWFLDQLQGPTAAYNVHVGLWLYGALNISRLQLTLQEIVNRHETFRTFFALKKSGLFQWVEPHHEVALPVRDFTDFPEPQPPAYELAKREVAAPFDLSKGPLFQARVMCLAPEEHVLLCTMHHTISDSWSTQIFVKELAAAYEALANGKPAELPELPMQYGDFSEWQQESPQGEMVQKQLDYRKETLKGAPPVLELPQDAPRPAEPSLEGASQTYAVPSEIMAGIRLLATRHRATPFRVLLAGFLAGRNGSGLGEWPQTYWPGENFRSPRFRAPVVLFKRPRQPYYYIRDPQMGWGGRSAGGIEICEVDCDHFEMLRQPFVRLIAEPLTRRLQEVNERTKSAGVTSPAQN